MKLTNYEAPPHAVLSILQSLPSLWGLNIL